MVCCLALVDQMVVEQASTTGFILCKQCNVVCVCKVTEPLGKGGGAPILQQNPVEGWGFGYLVGCFL